MAEAISCCSELPTIYELETGICSGVAGSNLSDVLGVQFLQLRDNSEELRVVRRKRLAWLFALLGLLPLLVFKYYNFLNESVSAGLVAVGLQFALPGLNWAVPDMEERP